MCAQRCVRADKSAKQISGQISGQNIVCEQICVHKCARRKVCEKKSVLNYAIWLRFGLF